MSVSVKLPTGSDVVFDLDPLSFEIDPKASSHRVLAPKIELSLVKKVVGAKWNKLERDPEQSAPVPGEIISKPLLPAPCDVQAGPPSQPERPPLPPHSRRRALAVGHDLARLPFLV